jgi:hypothetical protein
VAPVAQRARTSDRAGGRVKGVVVSVWIATAVVLALPFILFLLALLL